ncbi:MAG TPA: hypothetical protein PLU49_01075 [Saprospiraceae bacterium]|nr:hypothetical protein [Saprospiraceae bacterium]
MILAPNRLQPLNGSSWMITIAFLFLFSSCGIFSGSSGYHIAEIAEEKPVSYHSVEDTIELPDGIYSEADTIVFEIPEEKVHQADDILDVMHEKDLRFNTEYKEVYHIAILLPLSFSDYLPDLMQLESHYSYRFLNFYSGLQLGLEELSKKDVSLEVHVLNTKLSDNDFTSIEAELKGLDLDVIIGPFDRELLKEIEQFGKSQDILVISPWQSSTKIAKENPGYIQLLPDVKRYYEAIVQYVDGHFSADRIFLVGRLSEKQEMARLKYLQDLHKANPQSSSSETSYQQVYVNQASFVDGANAFGQIFQNATEEIAVIIPNWSYKDEQFVYSCLRKLNAEKGLTKVNVFGMPLMVNSELVDYNLFKNLNIHIAIEKHVDEEDPAVLEFRQKYLNTYHAIATDDAIEGFDLIQLVGESLKNYGTKFQYFIQGEQLTYLQTSYNLTPAVDEESVFFEEVDKVDYFENRHIEIRRFIHNRFEPAP